MLLVQGYLAKSGWGFPKGKVNKEEAPHDCAAREVNYYSLKHNNSYRDLFGPSFQNLTAWNHFYNITVDRFAYMSLSFYSLFPFSFIVHFLFHYLFNSLFTIHPSTYLPFLLKLDLRLGKHLGCYNSCFMFIDRLGYQTSAQFGLL